MDVPTFLIVVVMLVITLSAYLLFNDVPRLGGSSSRRRR